jgi:hypothetical protein
VVPSEEALHAERFEEAGRHLREALALLRPAARPHSGLALLCGELERAVRYLETQAATARRYEVAAPRRGIG